MLNQSIKNGPRVGSKEAASKWVGRVGNVNQVENMQQQQQQQIIQTYQVSACSYQMYVPESKTGVVNFQQGRSKLLQGG